MKVTIYLLFSLKFFQQSWSQGHQLGPVRWLGLLQAATCSKTYPWWKGWYQRGILIPV